MMDAALITVEIANDNSFGPQLGSKFDLTVLFEDTILTILPASLLIATSPIYFLYYSKLPIYISASTLLYAKLVSHYYANER